MSSISSLNDKEIKLHYFPINGGAMIARMLLHFGKINYKNVEIPGSEWPQYKPKFEFQFLPVLEINENSYSQMIGIYTYIAKKVGKNLMGKTDEQEYQILSLMSSQNDNNSLLYKMIFSSEEDLKNEELQKTHLKNAVDKITIFAKAFESWYIKNGEGEFFLGDELSLADFWLVSQVYNFLFVRLPKVGEEYKKIAPKLCKMIEGLLNKEPFKSFMESEYYYKNSI